MKVVSGNRHRTITVRIVTMEADIDEEIAALGAHNRGHTAQDNLETVRPADLESADAT